MINALIFDFDGLLIDTETPAFESWRIIYAEHGQELPLDLWKGALGTNHGFDALTHLSHLLGTSHPQTHLLARRSSLKHTLSATQPLLPGVRNILHQAHTLGLPCAIASSSTRAWVEGWLNHHQIHSDFSAICTAEDVIHTKPAPDLFLCAAATLNTAPQTCLVFEDSPNGILAATAAGMHCVVIPGAITRQLALPPADLLLPSLDTWSLVTILSYLETIHRTTAPTTP